MSILSEANQKLIFWLGTAALTLCLGLGTIYDSGIQKQFENQNKLILENRNKLWEQQKEAVTEEGLNRRLEAVMDIMNSKITGIQDLQKEQTRQLELLIKSQSSFQSEIRNALQEKVDKR